MSTRVVHVHGNYDVYIGRAGHGEDGYFGNPIKLAREADRGAVLARYAEWFHARIAADPEFRRRVLELRGKRLGCFCAPKRCHGDVIAAWIDSTPP